MNNDISSMIETYKTNLSVLWNVEKELIRFYIIADNNQNCYINFFHNDKEEKVYL